VAVAELVVGAGADVVVLVGVSVGVVDALALVVLVAGVVTAAVVVPVDVAGLAGD
jgi:hypothetical protein